jgi:hypothetical protein
MDACFTRYHVLVAFQHNLLPAYHLAKEGRSREYLAIAITSIIFCSYELKCLELVSLLLVTCK